MAQLSGDVLHPALGLVVLTFLAVLNLYKPRGLATYGRRQQAPSAEPKPHQHDEVTAPGRRVTRFGICTHKQDVRLARTAATDVRAGFGTLLRRRPRG